MSNIYITDPLPWEEVIFIIKKHYIVYIEIVFNFVIWIIISTIFIFFFYAYPWMNLFLVIFWMAFPLFLVVRWLDNALDMFVITNRRIIWIEQISFLNKTVSECNLSQVEEVWSQTKWFFANFFNFWDIKIQTAWNKTNFNMWYVPDPIKTAWNINTIINKYAWRKKV